MKKLLVVFSGTNYSSALAEFALKLAKESASLLHGVFVSPAHAPAAQYPFPNDLPLTAAETITLEESAEENRNLIMANVQVFRDSCKEEQIACSVTKNIDFTLDDVLDHSAFADLLLCDAKEELGDIALRDLLTDTRCPVLLVPQGATLPQRAVLCYDESFSSMLAMKMYSYLFPEWRALPSAVLSINPKGTTVSGTMIT